MNLRPLLLACCWILVTESVAGSVALLETAVDKWAGETDRWSLVQHVREYRDDVVRESRVERFDPSQPDQSRWQLLEINGRAPTRNERKAFDARKNTKRRMRFESPGRYIDFEHVTVLEETDATVTFDVPLRGNVSLLVPFEDVTATVVVDKETQTIQRVDLGLRREMKIAWGLARVTQLHMALDLKDPSPEADTGGDTIPSEVDSAGFANATIKQFGRRIEIAWTNFIRVDDKAE